jgi:phosphate transport system protein
VPEHSSRVFEIELRELRAQILAMGARCERSVGLAVDGFLGGTPDVMREVEALDAQIDRDDVEIHSLILRILALRSPVAGDLRFLTTALRLVTDLERIGDEAVNVAERAVEEAGGATRLVADDFGRMADAARDMLHLALDAFVRWDDRQAGDVLERDDEVDRRCAAIIDHMTGFLSEHPAEAAAGLRAIRVAKYLERIADHATNVAEEVIFMVRGDDVRHGQWQHLAGE